jgi:hypothetical protein
MRIVEGIFGNHDPMGTYMKIMDPDPLWRKGQRYPELFQVFNTKWMGVKNAYATGAWQIAYF